MEGLFTLLTLCVVMAVVSFLVGSLPLSFPLSSSQLRLISALGMGVLVGTSLVVIIPEGVETLYSSVAVAQTTNAPRVATRMVLHEPRWMLEAKDTELRHVDVPKLRESRRDDDEMSAQVIPGSGSPHNPVVPTEDKEGEVHILDDSTSKDGQQQEQQKEQQHKEKGDSQDNDHDHDHTSPHAWIGVALISGFILMYLIDKLPQYTPLSLFRKTPPRPYHISLDNLSSALPSPSTSGGAYDGLPGGPGLNPHGSPTNKPMATTTGLVIHAAADGIALGSSSSASNTKLSFIIFLAIILHKAPAAFGLTSVLLQQGSLTKRSVRAHLLVFSLAAPVGAVLTWLLAHTLFSGAGAGEAVSEAQRQANIHWRTGMLLLFSAGTFLYVAMHTMQDVSAPHGGAGGHMHGSGSGARLDALFDGHEAGVNGGNGGRNGGKKGVRDLVASVVGMVLPLFLQIGHAH